jgi:hypothetical protein
MAMTSAKAPSLSDVQTRPLLSTVREPGRERRWALIIPREHGAWGLLLVPLITGACLGLRENRNYLSPLLLLIAALSLFWMRTPLENLMGTSPLRAQTKGERRGVNAALAVLASFATLALLALLRHGNNLGLWSIALGAGLSFTAQALLKSFCRSTPWRSRASVARPARSAQSMLQLRMLAEIIGAAGLALSAPAAFYVVTGRFGATAWLVWLANLLFAGNQIHYVQLRIHNSRLTSLRARLAHGWTFAVGQSVIALALFVTCLSGLIPWLLLVAFVPILLRGYIYFLRPARPLVVRHLGWSELAQSLIFSILFVATFPCPA